MQFLILWAESVWSILVDSAIFFLAGLVLAGLIWLVLNEKNLARLTGKSSRRQVFRAALVGIPLPLCSCSVLPVADQLRSSGVSKAGTISFLVATPESSIDSILLTWSLTDPLLTVVRPITAFVTATVTGLTESAFEEPTPVMPSPAAAVACHDCNDNTTVRGPKAGLWRRITAGQRHAFTTLISDLAPYLLVGYLLAGLVAALLGAYLTTPPAEITSGWLAYLGVIILGLPLYMCATSSTPLAAVLLSAGFSPGAILVFLLVGPATNIASLAVMKKILGMQATVRYLISIVLVSVICGLATDRLYSYLELQPDYSPGDHVAAEEWPYITCAIMLAVLIFWHLIRKWIRRRG